MYISGREKVSYSILAVFTILWAGAFSLLGMDLHHDGVMFKAAADAAAGKAVFREIFSQYGILCPLFQGLILKITGVELAALKLATACFYGGIVVLSDLLWRRFLTLPFRILNLIMFFVLAPYLMVPFHIWSSVYALFFILLAAELMLLGISPDDGEKKRFFFLSGICTALVFGFRQPCGEVTLLAQLLAVAFLVRVRGRQVLKYALLPLLAGTAAVLLLYAVYLTAANAWQDYLLQNFKFISNFAYRRGGSGDLATLLETFFPRSESINYIFCIIPLAALVLFFWHSRKFFSAPQELAKDLPLITLLLFGLSSYHQYYPVPCVRHLYWGALPMFGAYALVLQNIALSQTLEKYKKVFAFCLLLPVLIWGGGLRMYGGLYRLSEFFRRESTGLPGLRMIRHGRMELFVCQFAEYLNKNLSPELKQRGVFNYTADGVWAVVLPEAKGFRNPMFVNWKQDVYADYPAKAMEYVDRNRPAVLADTPFFHPSYGKVNEFQYMGKTYSLYLPRQ